MASASDVARTAAKSSADQPSVTPVAGLLGEEFVTNPGCEEMRADSRIPSWRRLLEVGPEDRMTPTRSTVRLTSTLAE